MPTHDTNLPGPIHSSSGSQRIEALGIAAPETRRKSQCLSIILLNRSIPTSTSLQFVRLHKPLLSPSGMPVRRVPWRRPYAELASHLASRNHNRYIHARRPEESNYLPLPSLPPETNPIGHVSAGCPGGWTASTDGCLPGVRLLWVSIYWLLVGCQGQPKQNPHDFYENRLENRSTLDVHGRSTGEQ